MRREGSGMETLFEGLAAFAEGRTPTFTGA